MRVSTGKEMWWAQLSSVVGKQSLGCWILPLPLQQQFSALAWLPSCCLVPAAFSCLHNCSWLLCLYSDAFSAVSCLWCFKVASSFFFSVLFSSFSCCAATGYGQQGPGCQMCPKQILSQQTFFSGQVELAKLFFFFFLPQPHQLFWLGWVLHDEL